MNRINGTLAVIAVLLALVMSGCSTDGEVSENQDSASLTESRSEHERDEESDGEGEESGTELALNETYDKVRNGARLILAYDAKNNCFKGTAENTTDQILKRVRVEVHLSNGKELGPTTPIDLGPGEKRAVKLAATSKGFDGWIAHPEVGSDEEGGEHGPGEGRGEHDREGSEHGREGRSEHR